MRYQPDHKAKTRRRIVRHAARQFRVQGLGGPGVAEVMKAAGLTVGGFYKHFRNKDDLLFEAIAESMRDMREKFLPATRQAPASEGWKVLVKEYLSVEHCDHAEAGCPMAALSTEIGRASASLKSVSPISG